MNIRPCQTEAEIRACFPAMHELRPHLVEDDFAARVQRQMENHGYQLVAATEAEQVVAVAGYRIAEYLAWGRVLYVDDLVTAAAHRRAGRGGALLDWLIARARELGCAQCHLDSGVVRHDAHRLYLGRKLTITSHHFALKLD
jgi:GNAT superfamily N-acetyltransferase